jgi:hypothetical protein
MYYGFDISFENSFGQDLSIGTNIFYLDLGV